MIDMTRGMQLIREFCDLLVISEKATKIRIVQSIKLASNLSVSQEANYVKFSRQSIFGGASLIYGLFDNAFFFRVFWFHYKGQNG
ncbi:hypothetical protein P3S67_008268 [Capsicum chacoense]